MPLLAYSGGLGLGLATPVVGARSRTLLGSSRRKWHVGCATRAYTPTYRGYASFLGYYHAMTEDHWAHTHATGSNCPGPGMGRLWNDMSNSTGDALGMSLDNGTYESTLFGDHAVNAINTHARWLDSTGRPSSAVPLFMYIAFHNEHDPHQAPKAAIDQFESTIRSDTYKVTAAQIATMDFQIGRIYTALNDSGSMLEDCIISFTSDNGDLHVFTNRSHRIAITRCAHWIGWLPRRWPAGPREQLAT
eukprot:SAG31_NODE_2078_length_6499_cov_2.182344_4_plen_247_part_00